MKRRVVITGLGIVSPVGNDLTTAWDNIVNGRSGISRITRFDPSAITTHIAGEVKDFDISTYISAKEARQMDTFIHYGLAAGMQAWRDSGLEVTEANAERIGVIVGSGIGLSLSTSTSWMPYSASTDFRRSGDCRSGRGP